MKTSRKVLVGVALALALLLGGALLAVDRYGARFGIWLLPPSTERYVGDALDMMELGIYASGDDWQAARAKAREAARGADGYEACHEIIEEALEAAGGKHSQLMAPGAEQAMAQEQEMPSVGIGADGIVVITLPPCSVASDGRAYAESVAGLVNEHADEVRGAIVDLRGNTGGDMGPMIAAVSGLLPDGELLSFDVHGVRTPVTLAGGSVSGGGSAVTVEGAKLDVPVAILQDDLTASSGEATLLAFRGLPNARTFGSPSAGYCSCNSMHRLYDGATMLLTIGSDVARTGESFCEDPIPPDVRSDDPMGEARSWLLGQIGS